MTLSWRVQKQTDVHNQDAFSSVITKLSRDISLNLNSISPREQLSLNPAWCEATYLWFTDNCPLTIDIEFEKLLLTLPILPMANIVNKILRDIM